MKNVLFINISKKPFTGFYDGKPHTFKPGQEMLMPDYLASHFAKHLTNQILLEKGHEHATSPKFPEQVPLFNDLFKQIYVEQEGAVEKSPLEVEIEAANAQRGPSMSVPSQKGVQIVDMPVDDEDENAEFPELNNENEALKDL